MKKPLPRPLHGFLADYPYAALIATAPETVGFTENQTATTLSRVVGVAVTGLSLLTRYEAGVVRVVPYRAHLAIDIATGGLALAAPWMFGFARNRRARNTFLAAGAVALVVAGLLSEPIEMDEDAA